MTCANSTSLNGAQLVQLGNGSWDLGAGEPDGRLIRSNHFQCSRRIRTPNMPALVAAACLVLDLLCIHPFRDGNGRVSRLLTVLALYHHGIEVGRYISLERLIEESKEDYYAVLQTGSTGWHEGKHDLLPWLNYFLAIVRRAYVQFEERAGQVKSPRGAKTALLLSAIERAANPFHVADLQRACPGVSLDW